MSRTEPIGTVGRGLHDSGNVDALILHVSTFLFAVLLKLDSAALRIYAEEVRIGIVEIPFLSVDVTGFECLRLFPVVDLRLSHIRNVALDVLLHLIVGFIEVEGESFLRRLGMERPYHS